MRGTGLPRRRRPPLVAAALGLGLVLITSSCSVDVTGEPVGFADRAATTVAGLTLTTHENGLRGDAPDADPPRGDSGDRLDTVGAAAFEDATRFWIDRYAEVSPGEFAPPESFSVWRVGAGDNSVDRFCGTSTDALVNAIYCRLDETIGWDGGELIPFVERQFGPMGPVLILAHEYGHHIQYLADTVDVRSPRRIDGLVAEQQADCFAGSYIRYVAEDRSPFFRVNTTDGLTGVMLAVVAVRDADTNRPEAIHGSAFQRVTAFQKGFGEGPAACARITGDSVYHSDFNVHERGFAESIADQLRLDEAGLAALRPALESFFEIDGARPEIRVGLDGCGDSDATSPVSFCPDEGGGRITVDLEKLDAHYYDGSGPSDLNGSPLLGDFSAIALVASRYALAQAHSRGDPTTGMSAGLHAACVTGAWTRYVSDESARKNGLVLDTGDVDEAVMALLDDGYIASDTDGITARSTFARIDAYRTGVDAGLEGCSVYSD